MLPGQFKICGWSGSEASYQQQRYTFCIGSTDSEEHYYKSIHKDETIEGT